MGAKRSKNQLRREKAKLRKTSDAVASAAETKTEVVKTRSEEVAPPKPIINGQTPTSVEDDEPAFEDDALLEQFKHVINKFHNGRDVSLTEASLSEVKEFVNDSDDAEDNSDSEDDDRITSKRKLRLMNKIPLADLKSFTDSPQLVEWYDADAPDPYMLITLKSQPNVVQVPEHWANKRDYLSLRKGIDRPSFELPDYIKDTGIQDLRNNDDATLKQEQRARVQPKMGKLDIDYQKLHDAFFKFQTKPKLLGFGDLYYEGREATDEYDGAVDDIKPGVVSKKLRAALGLTDKDTNSPPPWITIMQQIGKPPSYEKLLIPGIDMEYSNKGYTTTAHYESHNNQAHENFVWGVLEEGESSEEEEEEEEDESELNDPEEADIQGSDEATRNPEKVELTEFTRYKTTVVNTTKDDDDVSSNSKPLYTVIKENALVQGSGLLLGDFGYEIPSQKTPESNEIPIADVKKQETEKFKF